MAKCLWYLEKAHRNAVRRHLKAGERKLALREAEAERANAYISVALREGWATIDQVRCLYQAGDEARPYRPQDIHCAAAAFLKALSEGHPPLFRFEVFASELQLNEDERFEAAEKIGVRLIGQPTSRNSNEDVRDAFASRSQVRRILRRRPR
jgi:hypothetical protein